MGAVPSEVLRRVRAREDRFRLVASGLVLITEHVNAVVIEMVVHMNATFSSMLGIANVGSFPGRVARQAAEVGPEAGFLLN